MRYEIKGDTLPVLICYLENGERMVTEGGGMAWMSPNMKMETSTNGGIGKVFGRMFSGETIFQNFYTAMNGNGMIAFASSFPGAIKPFHIAPGNEIIALQKVSGQGVAFAEFDGHVVEYELQPGQKIIVDTGHLAAMSATCTMEIKSVPGVKNMLFGGEGFFNTEVTGPGHIWLQSMPISNMAGVLRPYFPGNNS